MPVVEQLTGRAVVVDGQERLYFSGTSYLGMNANPELAALLQEGGERYGTTYSSSRASNLKLAVYEEAENMLAAMVGAEAALTFSSGYMAAQALIRTLDKGQPFFYAPDAHPALWRTPADANHTSYTAWVQSLEERFETVTEEVVLVMNSVDPLRACKYNFDWVARLPADKQITLVLDDSHGLGVLGEKGAGMYPELKRLVNSNVRLVLVSSLGKALGIAGGVVMGSEECIATLRKSLYFVAGSPAPPAYMHAFVHAGQLYAEARQQLQQNVQAFQELVVHTQLFAYFDTYPVFYTSNHDLYFDLKDKAIISCFPYPEPNSEPITRIIINSLHTSEDIAQLAEMIGKYSVGGEVGCKV
ncbi:MAG: aminotransferase class I/II-fold pyridoxal phosphate-dependent enzyme [Pontibacter sp.]|nr:aminotransferase class I/II-fold pyridoxal phosphate-dependent enzyme [Pontibacter sp.]